jgi:adenylate cyclase
MNPLRPRQPQRFLEIGSSIRMREVRLISGLVLGAFLLTHFSNHALGLFSVEVMESARQWFNVVWRNPLGTALL